MSDKDADAGMSGGSRNRGSKSGNNGRGAPANAVLFVCLDVERFAGTEHFVREVSDLGESVRSCPRAEGVQEIMLPGDAHDLEIRGVNTTLKASADVCRIVASRARESWSSLSATAHGSFSTMYLLTAATNPHAVSSARENWNCSNCALKFAIVCCASSATASSAAVRAPGDGYGISPSK